MLIIVVILTVPQLMKAWRYDPHAPENVAYYGVAARPSSNMASRIWRWQHYSPS